MAENKTSFDFFFCLTAATGIKFFAFGGGQNHLSHPHGFGRDFHQFVVIVVIQAHIQRHDPRTFQNDGKILDRRPGVGLVLFFDDIDRQVVSRFASPTIIPS